MTLTQLFSLLLTYLVQIMKQTYSVLSLFHRTKTSDHDKEMPQEHKPTHDKSERHANESKNIIKVKQHALPLPQLDFRQTRKDTKKKKQQNFTGLDKQKI